MKNQGLFRKVFFGKSNRDVNYLDMNISSGDKVRATMKTMCNKMKSSIFIVKSAICFSLFTVLLSLSPSVSIAAINQFDDFEAGLGNWQNVTGDQADWTRDSGGTPSNNTGPSSGAQGSTWYMYIEATGMTNGQVAYLESVPTYNSSTNKITVSFYYHMFGGGLGFLRLEASKNGGAYQTIWDWTGTSNNAWVGPINVDVDSAGTGLDTGVLKFRFAANRGSSFQSDATVDSITISGVDRCAAVIPTNLAAPSVTSSSVGLTWDTNVANDYYIVFRDGVQVATNVLTGSYTDTTVSPGTTYNTPGYTVRGHSNAGTCDSADSTAVQVTTQAVTNNTSIGAMTFPSVGPASITVSVPYGGDDNDNNTCTLAWGPTAGPYPNSITATNDRVANTCTGSVSGLSPSTTYYFQAIFTDGDGVTGSPATGNATTTSVMMMHNSDTTFSTYWGGSWGVAGGQYGAFGCDTCHEQDPANGNIKRIRVSIAPNGPSTVVAQDAGVDYGDNANSSSDVCMVCHSQTAVYQKGNSAGTGGQHPPYNDPTYDYKDCIRCHKHNKGFRMRGGCVDCHDINAIYPTSAPAAPKVVDISGATFNTAAYGTHLKAANGDNLAALNITPDRSVDEWTTQCLKCHDGHDGDLMIPNNAAVGINYAAGGIQLGGTHTTGSTEANICWNCHDANTGGAVSEWNAISDHGFSVTGGSDWTATNFALASAVVPSRPVLSMHSADDSLPASTASSVQANINWAGGNELDSNVANPITLEPVSSIRCSHCHDVHGTADHDGTIAAANDPDVAPYLRGTWLHNPYVATAIERPPQNGDSWTNQSWSHFDTGVTVPRLRIDQTSKNAVGGYQIDQNNTFPTSSYLNAGTPANELTNTAGLCVLCHGNNPRLYDAYADASDTQTLWLGGNGHANSSLGGDRTNARNLFDARNRDGQLNTTMGFYMAGQGADSTRDDSRWGKGNVGGSDRRELLPFGTNGDNATPDKGNNGVAPPRNTGYYGATAGAEARNGEYSQWYNGTAIGDLRSTSNRAHDFSCSKCHTPHASGLPALLVTNCLDYTISDWSDTASGPKNGSNVTIGPAATNRYALEAMNNCHRKKNTTTGWHKLAPAQ